MFKVLFVDSNHHYRNKFSEIYFNAVCGKENINALAYSASFSKCKNPADIMNEVLEFIENQGLTPHNEDHKFRLLSDLQLSAATKIICMDMQEHLTMLRKDFPLYVRKADYWHFNNAQFYSYNNVFPRIQREVDHLISAVRLMDVPGLVSKNNLFNT